MNTNSGYFKILLSAFIWGTIGIFARWSGLAPLELSFFRLLSASAVLYAFLPRHERLLIFYTGEYVAVLVAGLLFAIDCLLFFHALQLTTISNAVIPYYMQPVFVAVLSPFVFNEVLERKSIQAFILSLVGVGIMLFPSIIRLSYHDVAGILLSLGGAFCLALIAMISKKLRVQAATFVYYMMLVSLLCLLPLFLLRNPGFPVNLNGIAFAAGIGVVHTALAYILYYDGLKEVSMQYAVTLSYITPVVASLVGFYFFNEILSLHTVIGGVFIVLNGALVFFRADA